MARTYQVPPLVVNQVMAEMKKSHLVHPEAVFNRDADQGRRREVAYRDLDFLDRLGKTPFEELVVDDALAFLKDAGVVPADAAYDKQAFEAFRHEVAAGFTRRAQTYITPVMERLYYMLTSVKRPQVLAECGSFWGNSLAWFAGPCIGRRPAYAARVIYGIDLNAEATAMAKENFGNLPNTEMVELLVEDARVAFDRLPGPFDFVYTDANRKGYDGNPYLGFLKKVYPKLSDGGWFMAHDATRYTFQDELQEYFAFVRDKRWFRESILFDVDGYGIELSVK